MTASRFVLPLLLGLLVLTAGCDSGDPIDEPDPTEVAGTYRFTQFVFEPDATAITPANVLARLDSAGTSLRLTNTRSFLLTYEFESNDLSFIIGNFDLTAGTVRLNGSGENPADYQRILLDQQFTLQRNANQPGVLTASIQKRVNLQAYNPQLYAGLESVPGTLRMRLVTTAR